MVNRLRLASGLILLVFIAGHLLNHVFGLISVGAMNNQLYWSIAPWRTTIGTMLLLGALVVHTGIALWSLYDRRTLRLRPWEAAQLILGLLVPIFLVEHVLGTRVAVDLFDLRSEYVYVLTSLWVVKPSYAVVQAILVFVAWGHACIGLHYWLRFRPWYGRIAPLARAVALLLPALALAGFVAAGMEIRRQAMADGFVAGVMERARMTPEIAAFVIDGARLFQLGFIGIVGAVLAARFGRQAWRGRNGRPQLTYPDGRVVEVEPGSTVLDASRANGIPHASVCGGRGRCSTCRVRIGQGLETLPAPEAEEKRVLARIGAPPNVRLACQIRPVANLEVAPLLPVAAAARGVLARPGYLQGQEREIAILFADLREFTALAEAKLPYDVVFLLNRYFESMGHAVERAGGRLDKFIGDGVMALFGVERGPAEGCRRAVEAARVMAEALDDLNHALAHDLPSPLRMGIGIHVGPAIIGEMGYGHAKSLTAVGNAVNIASRLEALTKSFGVQLVMSEDVVVQAGIDVGAREPRETKVRGKAGVIRLYAIPSARDLKVRQAS
ncbi:MAG TPA: adenylate/guanylate cyclase domain-containing protein [Alphaproteobacteria bacterium]|nr:adenylate/guanylate cyclase domain-containing protein [Alphaproteobacteria bacterium]